MIRIVRRRYVAQAMNTNNQQQSRHETALALGYTIRDLASTDYPSVLALNSAFERFLSPMDETRLVQLHQRASYARVALHHSSAVAFLLAFRERAIYDSPNYVWFDQRYPSFLYIDRIVVSADHQGKRLGRALYTDLFRFATEARIPRVTCEFDIEPPNEASRRFHAEFGFREVGTQRVAYGRKQVSLQEASLSQ